MPRKSEKSKRSAAEASQDGLNNQGNGRTAREPSARRTGPEGEPSSDGSEKGGTKSGKKVRPSVTDPPPTDEQPRRGVQGVPGSKDDSRRCSANKASTGERCKAPAIKGGSVCRVHGGAAPQVRKSAQQRLLELVEPALAALYKVLTDKHADDSVKVRAAVAILDRTGHGPSASIKVQDDRWDALLEGVAGDLGLDRDLPEPQARESKGATKAAAVDDGGGAEDDVIDAEWYEEQDPAPVLDSAGYDSASATEGYARGSDGGAEWTEGPLNPSKRVRVDGTEMDPEPVERYGRPMETREEYLLRNIEDGLPPRNQRRR